MLITPLILSLLLLAGAQEQTATFSIVAYDEQTDDLGVAVASKFLAVGAVVPWAKAGVGAIATQALANPRYGPDGLALLARGRPPATVIRKLTRDDPQRDERQVGVVDSQGRVAAYTGPKTFPFAGHKTGRHYACQGNLLVGPHVLDAMAKAFEESQGEIAERLVAALEAGDRAGGDRRGKQSAALLGVRKGGGFGGLNDRAVDLRVDDHPEPIAELKRLLALHRKVFPRRPAVLP